MTQTMPDETVEVAAKGKAPAAKELSQVRLTMANGGWVIVVAMIIGLALLIWGLAPAVLGSRPPGDGKTLESYQFNLENATVPMDSLLMSHRHRDLVVAMDDVQFIKGSDVDATNEAQRGKMLVPRDRVIGVTINGESRAYPLRFLNCHEVINDTLGGTPIAVTYSPIGDSAAVYERRINGETLALHHSGLVHDCNTVFYQVNSGAADQDGEIPIGNESLWQQLTGEAITGPFAGQRLKRIPCGISIWAQWLVENPESTVIKPDPTHTKRYKEIDYARYFMSEDLYFPVDPEPATDVWGAKDQVVVVLLDGRDYIFGVRDVMQKAGDSMIHMETVGDWELTFICSQAPLTAYVARARGPVDASSEPVTFQTFWAIWNALKTSPQS